VSRVTFLPLLACAAGLAGCGEAPSDGEIPEKTRASWMLTFKVDGADVKVPLEVMHVYLVDDEKYPETFEIVGPGVALVGEFPTTIHVGYKDRWDQLFGKTVPILPKGETPWDSKDSQITLPSGSVLKVLQGSFVASKTVGKFVDQLTLFGKFSALVQDEKGNGFTIEGDFAVHCITGG